MLVSNMSIARADTAQYMVLASFDFLSADEIKNFQNITLAAQPWNTTLTSYQVLDGDLKIDNKASTDALLVYPRLLNGYADIKMDNGTVAVLDAIAYNQSQIIGYEIVKTGSSLTVYALNGTSKTVLSSATVSDNELIVTLMDGKLQFTTASGTGIYQASFSNGLIALGAAADQNATFDKLTLYGLAGVQGTYTIDLGTKTIQKGQHITSFTYDISSYKDIKSAKLIVTANPDGDDPWSRWFIALFYADGKYWAPGSLSKITNAHRWPQLPSDYADKWNSIIWHSTTLTFDVTSWIQEHPKGTLYIGVQTSWVPWTVSAKLVIDAEKTATETTTSSSSSSHININLSNERTKYALIGLGAIILIIILIAALGMHGHHRKRGLAVLLGVFLILLVIGGIAAAVLAWLHPEYLTALAFGLGAIALIFVFMLLAHGRSIPNPFQH